MKRLSIVLLLVTLLVCIALIGQSYGYSYIYMVNMENLYNLKFGASKMPVLKELCTMKGIDYLYSPELINANNGISILVYVPPLPESREINYTEAWVLTGYTSIDP
jgi:hypothetical protein